MPTLQHSTVSFFDENHAKAFSWASCLVGHARAFIPVHGRSKTEFLSDRWLSRESKALLYLGFSATLLASSARWHFRHRATCRPLARVWSKLFHHETTCKRSGYFSVQDREVNDPISHYTNRLLPTTLAHSFRNVTYSILHVQSWAINLGSALRSVLASLSEFPSRCFSIIPSGHTTSQPWPSFHIVPSRHACTVDVLSI